MSTLCVWDIILKLFYMEITLVIVILTVHNSISVCINKKIEQKQKNKNKILMILGFQYKTCIAEFLLVVWNRLML